MLVLTRSVGQTIIIDRDISVTVTAVNGPQVQLGIIAPNHVPVDRKEVYIKKLEQAKIVSKLYDTP